MLRCLDVWSRGLKIRNKTEKIRARTPPSLLGIDRRIAYANRKYHSGLLRGCIEWVCWGMVIWSLSKSDENSTSSIRKRIRSRTLRISLMI